VLKLAERGLRERVEPAEAAPGRSFDHGRFHLILEPVDGGPGERVIQTPPLARPASARARTAVDRVPATLPICRGCDQYVLAHETTCPHCGSDIAAAREAYEADLAEVRSATAELWRRIDEQRASS
jgi:hypothetical protein